MGVRYGLFLAFIAACSGSGSTSYSPTPPPAPPPPPPPPAAGPTIDVSMTDNNGLGPYAFSPAPLTITVGTTVKWTNNGKVSHTATSDQTPAVWNSGTVSPAGTGTCNPSDPYCTPGTTPAGTYQRTFNTAGTFPYHCEEHKLQGMMGTITVNP